LFNAFWTKSAYHSVLCSLVFYLNPKIALITMNFAKFLLLLISLSLAACGQPGVLYLPSKTVPVPVTPPPAAKPEQPTKK
jgi:predicted small lipoprotein YifL